MHGESWARWGNMGEAGVIIVKTREGTGFDDEDDIP
jgi:hypothetical protein